MSVSDKTVDELVGRVATLKAENNRLTRALEQAARQLSHYPNDKSGSVNSAKRIIASALVGQIDWSVNA